jgi:hypothetical protein
MVGITGIKAISLRPKEIALCCLKGILQKRLESEEGAVEENS